MIAAIVALAALAASAAADAQTVVDGDTVDYKGVVVHLWGIDAPAKGQVCADGWPAGQAALDHLSGLVKGKHVNCDLKSGNDSPRVAAICKADGKDLGAEMVQAGMAWALTREAEDYTIQEANAMSAVRGVHAHPCMKAWEWRVKQLGKP